jgi:hypothetical protein
LEKVRTQIDKIGNEMGPPDPQTVQGLLSIQQFRPRSQTSLCSAVAEYHRRINVMMFEALARIRQARTAIAIERFQRRQNRLPGKLDELVPQYLKGIPVDPYDGRAMRYAVDGPDVYRLWAVGADFTDEKGLRAMIGGMFSDVVWRRLPPK